jgi:hypothetical protein
MSGWTNKFKADSLKQIFQRTTLPTNYYVALVTSDDIPSEDTDTMADLTEIDDGNGYVAGGYELDPGDTDFDFAEEDDTGNLGRVQVKDVEWTADGGPIPATGTAAYAVLTDDNATPADRKILFFWSLGGERSVQDGSPFRLINLEARVLETS